MTPVLVTFLCTLHPDIADTVGGVLPLRTAITGPIATGSNGIMSAGSDLRNSEVATAAYRGIQHINR